MVLLKLLCSLIKLNSIIVFIILFFLNSVTAVELNNQNPIEINSDKLIVDQNKNVAIFEGNVQAVQNNLHLTADKMIAYYVNNNVNGNNKWVISHINATGNVIIIDNTQKARGDIGVYNAFTETLELEGSVILTKEDNILQGQRLIYDIKTGNSKLFGSDNIEKNNRVKAILVPRTKND